MRRALPCLLLILLAACGGSDRNNASFGRRGEIPSGNVAEGSERPLPRPEFGAEQRMQGIYQTGFERAEFDGCWFSMTPEAVSTFRRIVSPTTADAPRPGARYRIDVVARRSVDQPGQPNRYGHMGGWPCEIRAHQLVTAEILP